jgi:putative membrane protein
VSEPTLIEGALAGLAATVPMTIAMDAMHDRLPAHERYPLPPAEIAERVAGEPVGGGALGQGQGAAAALALHFAVGAAAGAGYAPLAASLRPNPLLGGVAYGLAVWSAGYLGILPSLGILAPATEHPARRNALMIAAHVIWGAALGLLVEQNS